MNAPVSLKSVERTIFQSSFADGLWDIFLGLFPLQFAIVPILSERFGDFWSSFVFLPIWFSVYVVILQVRKNVVVPRIGKVTYGKLRQAKLLNFTVVILFVNVTAMILGITVYIFAGNLTADRLSYLPSLVFGLVMLLGLGAAGKVLDFPRLYLYGLLLGIAMPVGEWLFQNNGAIHHGYPIVFGFVAGFMIILGLILFARFVRRNPVIETNRWV